MIKQQLDFSHWEGHMPDVNRKLTTTELAFRFFNLSTQAKHLYDRWNYTESDAVWEEYEKTTKQVEVLRSSIFRKGVA